MMFPSYEQPLTAADITGVLQQDATTRTGDVHSGFKRSDSARAKVTSPCEDRLVYTLIDGPPHPLASSGEAASPVKWPVWGVFDGHGGWQTADLLTKDLHRYVEYSLQDLDPTLISGSDAQKQAVEVAITQGFTQLDDTLITLAQDAVSDPLSTFGYKASRLSPCYSGSCALLALLDPITRTLYVACAGDSRAVMGIKNNHGAPGEQDHYKAVPLSTDHGGQNANEIARIKQEHPGEDDVVKDEQYARRVLGMMCTRAFGDGRYKWPMAFVKEARQRFNGPPPLPEQRYLTPPYLTAKPSVTVTSLPPLGEDSFVIIATDGLWDTMSSQQGVQLIERWLARNETNGDFEQDKERHGQESSHQAHTSGWDLSSYPSGVMWQVEERKITVQDNNTAVHLLRNALGGSHSEMLGGALAFAPPYGKGIRDDMAVQVIFFS